MTPFLSNLPLGRSVDVSVPRANAFLAPFDGPDAAGRSLVLVAFGVGIADLVWAARRAADAGQRVALLYAVRTAADVILLPELVQLAREYAPVPLPIAGAGSVALLSDAGLEEAPCRPAGAGARGSVELHIVSSRADPPADVLRAARIEGPTPANLTLSRGRVDAETVAGILQGWVPSDTAVLSVGSKLQQRDAYRVLGDLGYDRVLLRPVANTSRYF